MSQLEAQIRQISVRFVDALPARVARIAETLERCQSAGASTAEFVDLTGQFHSLAGSAGTFGLEHVTELARQAETICGSAAFAGELIFIELTRLLSAIEVAVDDAVAGGCE